MVLLKILAHLSNFAVVFLIAMKTLNTQCFNESDINLSLAGLVFSVLVEIIYITKEKNEEGS